MESTQFSPALEGHSPTQHVRGGYRGTELVPFFSCMLTKSLLVPKGEAVRQTGVRQGTAKQNNPSPLGKSNKSPPTLQKGIRSGYKLLTGDTAVRQLKTRSISICIWRFFLLFIYNHLKGTEACKEVRPSPSQPSRFPAQLFEVHPSKRPSCGSAGVHTTPVTSLGSQHRIRPRAGPQSKFNKDTWPGELSTRLPGVRGWVPQDLLPVCKGKCCVEASRSDKAQWHGHKQQ